MSDEQPPRCVTCRWYDSAKTVSHGTGACRVNPPSFVGNLGASHFPGDAAAWPVVGEQDWCAMWSEK